MDVEKLAERYIQTNKADKKLKEEIFYTVNGVAPYVLKKMGYRPTMRIYYKKHIELYGI